MKKKAFAVVLTLLLWLGAFSAYAVLAAPTNDGSGESTPLEVPAEGLAFENGTIYGIRKAWFQEVNPDKNDLFLSVTIPAAIDGQPVTNIAFEAFTTAYTSEKKAKNAVTYNDKLGLFYLTAADFTNAVHLKTIQKQAFNNSAYLAGTVDLSNTALISIDKMAFQNCTKLTEVLLPDTLESLGAAEGGSVFKGCTALTSVRTKNDPADTAFSLPAQLKYIGTDTFNGAFARPVTVVLPESVIGIGSQAFYSNQVTRIVVTSETPPTAFYSGSGSEWLSGQVNTRALKVSGADMVLFPNAAVYEAYYNNYSGLTSEKNKFTFPITVRFLNEGGESVLETQSKLYNFPLNYVFAGDWAQDDGYRFPQINEAETQWFIDGNSNALKETDRLKSSPIQDTFELVPEVKTVVIPENPSVVPILDGERLAEGQNTITVGDDRIHSFGVLVEHALLEPPQNPAEGDLYVTFQYKWTDVVDGSVGPRSGGAGGWPEKEFGAFGPYNTIPIDGTAHARIDSGDYYLVEIEGYVLRYDGSEWVKDEKPYYKTKHTIIGGDNSGATVDRAYVFYVDVAETFSITYTDGLDEDLFADQVYDGLFPGDETPAFAGECRRDGYVFYGWTPAVTDTVSGDAVYTATWEADVNGNGVADKDEETYTVTYTDGVDGEEIFPDQVFDGLLAGLDVPAFEGTPMRDGYVFAGWNPEPADKVQASAIHTAVWKADVNGNGIPDEDEETYTVTYTDGVDGEEIFPDQVFDGLLVGLDVPAFEGTPMRDGYTFTGWSPEAGGTVSGDIVFTAQWKQDAPDDTSEGDTSEDSSSTPVSPESSEPFDPSDSSEPAASSGASESGTPSTGGGGIGAAALTLLCSAGILLQFIVRGRRKQAAE
ncbi:MAG: hypothetical protein DBY40_00405 [Clostridiales bacterium]|nr:MAG: hypothetical protein DBY40_00405 [Clostridiales bacterium]